MNREKISVDLVSMPDEQANEIADALNLKIQSIIKKAEDEANEVLKLYGLNCIMNVDILKGKTDG